MKPFVYVGNKQKKLTFREKNVTFLYKTLKGTKIPASKIKLSLEKLVKLKQKEFSNKKICLVIPDNTRNFHAKLILPPVLKVFKKISKKTDIIISLGLHNPLNNKELETFLGKTVLKNNKVTQHNPENVVSLGKTRGVPFYINKHILSYDLIFTIGVVEPHLYAGFSGGVKCLAIGLGGKQNILHTHSVKFFKKQGVKISNFRNNPFQQFLWQLVKKLNKPIYSLNIINNYKKQLCFYTIDKALPSFTKTIIAAKKLFSYKTNEKFDILFVGCDYPKQTSLYQVSRLFNYCLDKKPLVKKGGLIVAFANLSSQKSKAEENFEKLLQRKTLSKNYGFHKPGEHRTFKIISAAKNARLAVITPNIPKEEFYSISFFKKYADALAWAKEIYGKDIKIGIIPSGFTFIPS